MIQLRDYQQTASSRVFDAFRRGVKGAVIVIPPGGGKTLIFLSIAQQTEGQVIILVNSEELRRQTVDKLKAIDIDADYGVVQGSRNETDARIIVASVQTLSIPGRLEQMPQDPALIIVDECHHAVAPEYLRILDHYKDVRRLGVTATPERLDGLPLTPAFDEIVFDDLRLRDLIDKGNAAPITGIRVLFSFADQLRRDEDIEHVMRLHDWKEQIAKAWREHLKDRRSVFFLPSIETAESLVPYMRDRGLACTAIHGELGSKDRQRRLQAFESGVYQAIIAIDLLIEGVDLPFVNGILMARNTQSQRIAVQSIGRGTRPSLATGKTDCKVVDMVGALDVADFSRNATLGDAADGPQIVDMDDLDVPESEFKGIGYGARPLLAGDIVQTAHVVNVFSSSDSNSRRGSRSRRDKPGKQIDMQLMKFLWS